MTYIYIIAVIIVCYVLFKIFDQRFFAYFMNRFAHPINPIFFGEAKRELFKDLRSLVKNNKLNLLEVGVGTGTNFKYYPNGTHLVVIDPNPYFKKYYNESRKKFPNIKSEEINVTTGEEMDAIKPNSVDAAVLSHVLCSVTDIRKVLQNIHRALVPGGKLFIFEHILEYDNVHWLRRTIQQLLSVTGIWPTLFCGCHLNREMMSDIQAISFSKLNVQRRHLKIDSKLVQIVSSHLIGVVTK